MIGDNQSDHGRNPDVEEITQREMVILLKISNDHRDKLKVEKKDQDLFQEMLKVSVLINEDGLY